MHPTELERIEYVLDGCCSCHLNPPCSWCIALAEDEVWLDRNDLESLLQVKRSAAEHQERQAMAIVSAILKSGGDNLLDAVVGVANVRRR